MSDNRELSSETHISTSGQDVGLDPESSVEQFIQASDDNPARHLVRTIETEILPRLMLVHKHPQNDNHAQQSFAQEIGPKDVEELIEILFEQSVTAGHKIVDTALQSGVELEYIYMNLLAPAARRMGEMWDNDERDFSDVTIGLCRLHEILRDHSLQSPQTIAAETKDSPNILITTACGDQHVFGVIMVAEFFRKAGWLVTSEPGASTEELARIVTSQHFDVIGMSIARSLSVEEIANAIAKLRSVSVNKDVKIIVGGALLEREASIVADIGADGSSTDASEAPQAAEKLLANGRNDVKEEQ